MKNYFKNFIILTISFFAGIEFLGFIQSNENRLNTNYQGNYYFENQNEHSAYLVGDSFASTNYLNEGFPIIFEQYFKDKKWNFYDLSIQGSSISDHKKILDSLSNINPKLIIYFYNFNDIVSLNKKLLLVDYDNEKLSNVNYLKKNTLQRIFYSSKSIKLLKKSLQYLSLKITDRYLPSTPSYLFPIEHVKRKDELKKIFDSIKAENKLILINTPYNAGAKPLKWEQYQVFRNMNKKTDYKIVQSVDYINDASFGVSWRNAHPTQEAVNIIANILLENIDTLE
tara:strand:+ start:6914 stop:7762 length:849 start_codon:yes stop_codon:yes gene_type:complete